MGDTAVVVGVDGGEPSLAAARWAAAEAVRRAVALRIVLAYHWRVPAALAPRGELAELALDLAGSAVASVAEDVAAAAPGVSLRPEAVFGQPAEVLLHAGSGATLLVVGTRGRHGTTGALLGSVSQQVAAHATCPVVVVRGRPDPDGDVLVGADASACSDAAVELAFAEARLRECAVTAVRAVETPLTPPAVGAPPVLCDVAEVRRALSEEAASRVAAAAAHHPGVPWQFQGLAGDAARVLADHSRRAQLVVVGSRGHGGFTGLLLGSVGLRLLHRADCPVMIAHAPA